MFGHQELIGFAAASAPILTAFSGVFNQDDGSSAGFCYRAVTTALVNGGTQFRVTFQASTGSTWTVANASIGKSNSGGLDTTAIPVELKFSGASGFSLSAGQSITSDWATLTMAAGDKAVVTMDTSSGAMRQQSSATGVNTYYKAATAGYNSSNVSGMSTAANLLSGFNLIETQ